MPAEPTDGPPQLGPAHGARASLAIVTLEEFALRRFRARAAHRSVASAVFSIATVSVEGMPALVAPTTIANHAVSVNIVKSVRIACVANRFEASLVGIAPPANGDLAGRFAVPAEVFIARDAIVPEKRHGALVLIAYVSRAATADLTPVFLGAIYTARIQARVTHVGVRHGHDVIAVEAHAHVDTVLLLVRLRGKRGIVFQPAKPDALAERGDFVVVHLATGEMQASQTVLFRREVIPIALMRSTICAPSTLCSR